MTTGGPIIGISKDWWPDYRTTTGGEQVIWELELDFDAVKVKLRR